MKKTTIIDYGAGNVKSVSFALERLGIQPKLSANAEEIQSSDYVIFPGVGHADYAMQQLHDKGLVEVIQNLKQPVLGICLGMQLMCDYTEEGNVKGLGIFDVPVVRFAENLKVPHMGWNNLQKTSKLLDNLEEQVYFVHSYYAPTCEDTMATCNYHGLFSAALAKDNFYGCQFHPEKSGPVGEEILKRFLSV
jgi:imidazole glycerol-phosphate synthase subunit HisH